MKRRFTAKPTITQSSVRATTDASENESSVVAIQLDVELPTGVSAQDVISFIEDAVSNSTVQDFHIASIDICGDVTDRYEENSDLSDLLVYR